MFTDCCNVNYNFKFLCFQFHTNFADTSFVNKKKTRLYCLTVHKAPHHTNIEHHKNILSNWLTKLFPRKRQEAANIFYFYSVIISTIFFAWCSPLFLTGWHWKPDSGIMLSLCFYVSFTSSRREMRQIISVVITESELILMNKVYFEARIEVTQNENLQRVKIRCKLHVTFFSKP